MKNVRLNDSTDRGALSREMVEVLQQGGLVCVPCGGRYRILADLTNEDAVIDLLQSKGRIHKAPSLVFVDSETHLDAVAASIHPLALKLARAFWPKPLTVLVEPHPSLPSIIGKQLAAAHGKIGVRVPAEVLVMDAIATFGRPLLVSSANKENKHGDTSPAQIRKNFANRIALFVDKGDLAAEPLSTIIEVIDEKVVVTRQGAVSADAIQKLVGG
jgi:L-threonylcarbamoyladenylate synthase